MKPTLYKKYNYFIDERGAFYEMFKKKNYSFETVFTALSISKKNVIKKTGSFFIFLYFLAYIS